MKKYKIGYTSGVYDMFHIGHLNILKKAKELCDFLVVGVSTDEVVITNKNKKPVICYEDRVRIVSAIRYVDKVVPQEDYSIKSKLVAAKKYHADVVFVGSDWQGTKKWDTIEKELNRIGCAVVFLPHTDGISSTEIIKKIKES